MTVVSRPYARCQECGAKFRAARSTPECDDCAHGQLLMFDTKPEGFLPVTSKTKAKPRKTRCVRCKRRLWRAPGGQGSKSARPICDECEFEGCDGYTC